MLDALPPEIIEIIADNLDLYSLSQFSATCKKFSSFSNVPRRQLRRAEVLRCARIYGIMRDIVESWEKSDPHFVDYEYTDSLGKSQAIMLMTVIMDCYEMIAPSYYYRGFDPELYDTIADDMRMRAPPDVCLIWNFYNKIY